MLLMFLWVGDGDGMVESGYWGNLLVLLTKCKEAQTVIKGDSRQH